MAGFVYVMTNEAFSHLVKIGKSAKDPRQDRVNELNHTGVPQPFRVEYYAFVEDEGGIERWLHNYFDAMRPNKSREFFKIDVADAINAVRDAAKLRGGVKYEEVFYVSPKELEWNRIRKEEAQLREQKLRAEQRSAEEQRRQAQERAAAEERRRAEIAADQAERERQAAKPEFLPPLCLLVAFFGGIAVLSKGDDLVAWLMLGGGILGYFMTRE